MCRLRRRARTRRRGRRRSRRRWISSEGSADRQQIPISTMVLGELQGVGGF
jgi:hypothetical protein